MVAVLVEAPDIVPSTGSGTVHKVCCPLSVDIIKIGLHISFSINSLYSLKLSSIFFIFFNPYLDPKNTGKRYNSNLDIDHNKDSPISI